MGEGTSVNASGLQSNIGISKRGAVSQLLWKKRKAYSLGIPKTNWLME